MKASIIITTYSRPQFLQRSILSAQNQRSEFKFEVIVIDDNGLGSKDQIETEGTLRDKDLLYIALEHNSGACIARNKGAEMASGEYLFFLDDDDEFLPKKVQEQIKFLEENPELDGCLAAFIRKNEDGKELISEANKPIVGDFKNFVLHGNFFTPMLCIRKSSFEKTDGFIDIPRFQDKFFMINALLRGLKFGTIEEPLHVMYEHSGARVTAGSVDKTRQALKQIRTLVEQYKNNFSNAEWKFFLEKQTRLLAVTKYVSTDRKIRRSAALDFLKLFFGTYNMSDLAMVVKSLIR